MAHIQTKAIVLSRTNYGEADRIMNIITPDYGKMGVIARGVRREKSKLAGGIELLAISDLSIHQGKGSLSIVTSARLDTFFSHILRDYDRLQFAYYVLKDVSKASEVLPEPEFYEITKVTLSSLDNAAIPLDVVSLWYRLQMAILLGVGLNLATEARGEKLEIDKIYRFDVGEMALVEDPRGDITAAHIKFLRVATSNSPDIINKVGGIGGVIDRCLRIAFVAHE
ncbi:DNA repair protein RecO [Pedobacter sp.]|nr:DNA repair protein RecO [Candidatus Saccharibacteria bacterium]